MLHGLLALIEHRISGVKFLNHAEKTGDFTSIKSYFSILQECVLVVRKNGNRDS